MTETAGPGDPEGVRLRLDLAYDGAGFAGWARQPGLRTVQGVLEEALATIFSRQGPAPQLTVAGRTDSGVHATGQVAHLDLTGEQWAALTRQGQDRRGGARPPLEGLRRRLDGLAGDRGDVVLTSVRIAAAGFDARFAPLWRRYAYRVADADATRDPLRRGHTLWHAARLDRTAMDGAALTLVGLHDFASFCKPREGATTIRTLQEFRWDRDPDGVLVARLRADAFCHSMVRAMVGACLAVGEGRLTASDVDRLRRAEERTSAFPVAPARGLTLTEVGYPADEELADRVARTRARRERDDRDRPDPARSAPASTPSPLEVPGPLG